MPKSSVSNVPSSSIVLDKVKLEKATHDIENGAVTPSIANWKNDIVAVLNDCLATELVCVMRYRRHHFTAHGLASPKIAEELLVHANAELAHADSLAQRIVQLGGSPDFSPSTLQVRSHAQYDDSDNLKTMIKSNLIAERIAVETYHQLIELIGDKDPTTRRLLEAILADEEEHADELSDWLKS